MSDRPRFPGFTRRVWRWPPGCANKNQFASWADAEDRALYLSMRGAGALLAYVCDYCGWWHVGSWNYNRTPMETARMKGLL